jgi:uncharacterized protein (TIGR03435 family)
MHEPDDNTLLRQYAEQNSEAAFAALVARHVDKVYSVALRHTRNAHAAEEITQAVFVILAKKSGRLGGKVILSGWLYETARLTALTFIRSEIRRARREQEAYMQTALNENTSEVWPHIAPLLDDALAGLSAADRHAVVLRYFDGKSLGEVGAALGASEDAAKKRVTRAVEKLRRFFTKRGVTLTVTVLTAAISANSVQAAPLGLAATVTAAAAKGAAVSGSTLALTKGALKIMAWTKMKMAVVVGVGVLLAAGTATVMVKKITTPSITASNPSRADDPIEDIFKHLDTDPNSSSKLEGVSPTLMIRPTQYPTNGVGFQNPNGKSIVANTSIKEMIRYAYGFPTSVRMILPTGLPQGQFDYLNSLPDHQRDALRAELKKQFGLIAHVEIREADVMRLTMKDAEKLKSHLVQNDKPGNLGTFKMSRGIPNDSITGFESMQLAELLETIFNKPVIDQTGATSFYEWKSKTEMQSSKSKSREDSWHFTIDQLGLELVPSREPVEMLVIEKVK